LVQLDEGVWFGTGEQAKGWFGYDSQDLNMGVKFLISQNVCNWGRVVGGSSGGNIFQPSGIKPNKLIQLKEVLPDCTTPGDLSWWLDVGDLVGLGGWDQGS
jgi:hypothetical protein